MRRFLRWTVRREGASEPPAHGRTARISLQISGTVSGITLVAGDSYAVRVADFDGGSWKKTVVTAVVPTPAPTLTPTPAPTSTPQPVQPTEQGSSAVSSEAETTVEVVEPEEPSEGSEETGETVTPSKETAQETEETSESSEASKESEDKPVNQTPSQLEVPKKQSGNVALFVIGGIAVVCGLGIVFGVLYYRRKR